MRALDAFFTPVEQRLLGLVIGHPEREFGTLELLQQLGNGRGAGSALLQRWTHAGVLLERRVGNQRRFTANQDFLLFPELRRIAQKTVALTEPLAAALAPVADRLTEAFVFGSVAQGTDRADSDIDLALVGDIDLFDISPLLDAVQLQLGRPVHANVYRPAEWASEDPVLATIKNGARVDLMETLRAKTP